MEIARLPRVEHAPKKNPPGAQGADLFPTNSAAAVAALSFANAAHATQLLMHKCYARSVLCKCCARNAAADAQVLRPPCRLQMMRPQRNC